jgi:hypothetical protein
MGSPEEVPWRGSIGEVSLEEFPCRRSTEGVPRRGPTLGVNWRESC